MNGWRGHISYIGANGVVRGEETFTVHVAPDGRRTMTVNCRILDTDVWRDAVLTVDQAFAPVDAYVRIRERGRDLGAAWFWFGPRGLTADTIGPDGARQRRQIDLDRRAVGFGAHPVASDSWHVASLGTENVGVAQTAAPFFVTSTSYNGAEPPLPVRNDLSMTVHGRERIVGPDGEVECFHFELDDSFRPPDRRRRYHVWCTADGHFHFIKGAALGYMPTTYVLDRWEMLS